MRSEIQSLASACLVHLAREESLLASLQAVVERMRASLLSRNDDDVERLMASHARVSVEMEEIAANRNQLRQRISTALAVPQGTATVGLLAGQCDGETRLALAGYQARLKAASENLHRLLIAVSHLAMQMLELLENVFRSLSGDPARSPRYDRTGRPSMR